MGGYVYLRIGGLMWGDGGREVLCDAGACMLQVGGGGGWAEEVG